MQNRYVADVGDFGKFGLLRALMGITSPGDGRRLSLGVVWYRPSKEEGPHGDGSKRGYLEPSKRPLYEACDPELFGRLKEVSDTNRDLCEIEDSDILGDEEASFYNAAIDVPERHWSREKREAQRCEWFKGALERVGDKEIVFLDPDNGLAPRSVPIRLKGATKYTYLQEEIAELRAVKTKPVIVIYHHLGRSFEGQPADHPKQMHQWATKLRDEIDLPEEPEVLWYRRGTARAYFVLCVSDDDRTKVIRDRLQRFRSGLWFEREHFTPLPN